MNLHARNDPADLGAIEGRPVVLLPSTEHARQVNNRLFACAVHAAGSDSLRVLVFRAPNRSGEPIRRPFVGPETGGIEGTPGAAVRRKLMVTATHGESSGRLKLVSWSVRGRAVSDADADTDVEVERLSDSRNLLGEPGGTADLVHIGGSEVVVLVKTRERTLKLVLFRVKDDGRFERLGDAEAGRIRGNASIALTASDLAEGFPTAASPGSPVVTTAFRSSTGRLKLINWEVSGDRIRRRGDTGNDGLRTAGRPAIAGLPQRGLALVAFHEADANELRLHTYAVGHDGSIEHEDSRTGRPMRNSPSVAFARGLSEGATSGVPTSGGPEEPARVIATGATAVTDAAGELQVDRWAVSENGDIRAEDGTSGTGIRVAGSPWITSTVAGSSNAVGDNEGYFTAAREAGSNGLVVAEWH